MIHTTKLKNAGRKSIYPTLALLLFSLAAVSAHGVVLDFESLSAPGHPLFPTGIQQPYQEDGFQVTTGGGQAFSFYGTQNSNFLGTIMVFNNTLNPASSPAETKIESISGALFTVTNITLAKLNRTSAVSETFEGKKADDSTVLATFTVPSGTIASTITSFVFPDTFVDLKSLSWFQSQTFPDNAVVQIDNVVVTAVVPVPPALMLFGTALVTLVLRLGRPAAKSSLFTYEAPNGKFGPGTYMDTPVKTSK